MRVRSILGAGLLGLLAAGAVQASIVLNSPRTFDGAGNLDGWTSSSGSVPLTNPNTGGNPGGFLQITFNYGGGPPFPLAPVIVNSSSPYIGNYTGAGAMGITFDFYANVFAPAANPSIYLHSSTSSDTWYHPFTYSSGQVGSWVSYSLSLYDGNWTGGAGTFLTDIAAVDYVGLDLEGYTGIGGGGTQIFGLDNWTYTVPEPGSICLLAAAFLSIALTFRRPLQDALDRARAQV